MVCDCISACALASAISCIAFASWLWVRADARSLGVWLLAPHGIWSSAGGPVAETLVELLLQASRCNALPAAPMLGLALGLLLEVLVPADLCRGRRRLGTLAPLELLLEAQWWRFEGSVCLRLLRRCFAGKIFCLLPCSFLRSVQLFDRKRVGEGEHREQAEADEHRRERL